MGIVFFKIRCHFFSADEFLRMWLIYRCLIGAEHWLLERWRSYIEKTNPIKGFGFRLMP
jgi:hypothetical protein